MSKLFSGEWMQEFAKLWNKDQEMIEKLGKEGFSAVIGFGYQGQPRPAGVIEVRSGKVVYAGPDSGQDLNWDLRASLDDWRVWLTEGYGFAKLGISVASGKLKFATGDYRKMVRQPDLVKPFLRHFELMGQIKTQF